MASRTTWCSTDARSMRPASLRGAFLLVGTLWLAGCVHLPDRVNRELACVARGEADHYGNENCRIDLGPAAGAATWRGLPIEEGQIIVTEKPGSMALLMTLVAERFEPYVHAGLILFDKGRPYVYESFGVYLPIQIGRPTRGMRGGVRRVPLGEFLARGGITAVYEAAPGVDRRALAQYARDQLAKGVRFDEVFDAGDSRRVYCVEFVALAWQAASGKPIDGVPLTRNRSARVLLDWLEIRTPAMLLAGQLVAESRRVFLIGWRSRQQVDEYFARKRELHRRFTADQRLGHLFTWKRGLRLQPRIRDYLFGGTTSDADAVARAARMLGPF
jgi:hypothetical protein